jgi:hypothetical protein
MTMAGDSQQRIDAYLGRLRGRLRGANEEEIREIVDELRSHILDKAAASSQLNDEANGEITPAGVDAALAALRAEVSRSPVQILRSLFRWASLSVGGFFVLLGSSLGYFFGAVFILVGVAKLFHPHTAGLWIIPTGAGDSEISFRMGFGSVPAGGRDVLGWWIVPIGWVVGGGLVMLTTYIAVWFVRQYRKSRVRPWG